MDIRNKIKLIVFSTETKAGRLFDMTLLWVIVFSILVIMLESVPALNAKYHDEFKILEWIFTILFTLEYLVRVWVVQKKSGYIFSFFGIVDLLSVLPSYLGFFVAGYNTLLILRAVRLFRIFRVFQLTDYLRESVIMGRAMLASLRKIIVFLTIMIVVVMILGTLIYIVEGPENGFTSIPKSIYWAVVTITTVGYGDLTPATPLGSFIATIVMLLGYSILAVPTGIVAAEFTKTNLFIKKEDEEIKPVSNCPNCGITVYDSKSNFCRNCGASLHPKAGKPPARKKIQR